jgi:hypothetical protein
MIVLQLRADRDLQPALRHMRFDVLDQLAVGFAVLSISLQASLDVSSG